MKRPCDAVRPFPWKCASCGEREVQLATVQYAAEVRHDGRLYAFTVPALQIPTCRACGEKVFTEDVDRQIDDALRLHIKVFTPDQFREALSRVKLSQKDVAERLGIAEATISRWLNGTQIQGKSLDRYVRVFFAFPEVRDVLSHESLDPELGTKDVAIEKPASDSVHSAISTHRVRPNPIDPRSDSVRHAGARQLVETAGSTWGRR